ncbi:MAG: hypothetical protein ACXVEF_38480 [Polyangiales bacterium]
MVTRKHERWRIVALLRALAIVAAAFVIARGAVPAARVQTAAITVIAGRTAKAEPVRGKVVFHDQSAHDAQPVAALPPEVVAVAIAALASREKAPAATKAPRLITSELQPVARGPPSIA